MQDGLGLAMNGGAANIQGLESTSDTCFHCSWPCGPLGVRNLFTDGSCGARLGWPTGGSPGTPGPTVNCTAGEPPASRAFQTEQALQRRSGLTVARTRTVRAESEAGAGAGARITRH